MRVRIRRFEKLRSERSVTTASARVHISTPARPASPLRFTLGASPLLSSANSALAGIWCMAFPHSVAAALSLSFGPSSVGVGSKRIVRSAGLLWPLLTSRSAAQTSRQRRPFRHEARSPQVRLVAFSARPPDLHRLSLGRRGFAVRCPLASPGDASYPVSVRRPADALAPSFSPPLAVGTLGFAWFATTCSPKDSHLQVTSHAGHTTNRARTPLGARARCPRCAGRAQPVGETRFRLPA